MLKEIEVVGDNRVRTPELVTTEVEENYGPQEEMVEAPVDTGAEAQTASGTTQRETELAAHELTSSQGGKANVQEVTSTNGPPAPDSSRLSGSLKTREAAIKHLNSRLQMWADQMRTELALYQDGWHLWNRIQYDYLSKPQKRTLAPQIQELFEQQSEIEQAYRSLDEVGRYQGHLRTIPNLSDGFVRAVLAQRGYETPPRRHQGPATSEEVDSSQAPVSLTKSTERTGYRGDAPAHLVPEDPKRLSDEAECLLAECERVLDWASLSIQNSSVEREKQLKVIDSAREDFARARERYHRVVDALLGDRHLRQARQEMDAAERREVRERRNYALSDRFNVEYRKAVARELAGALCDKFLSRLNEMAASNDDPRLQQTVSDCKEGVERATRYIINLFSAQRPLLNDQIEKRAQVEARKIVNGIRVNRGVKG